MAVLAPSGAGKDIPQQCVRNAISRFPNLCVGLMGETPFHRAQLEDRLMRNRGQLLMQIDEYGSTMQSWLRGSTPNNTVTSCIRQLVGHGPSVYANFPLSMTHPSRKEHGAAWEAGIFAPFLAVIGFGTPGQFYDSLSDSALVDGFLGRHLVLESGEIAPMQEPELGTDEFPGALEKWVEAIQQISIPKIAPYALRNPNAPPDLRPAKPGQLDWGDGAQAAWVNLVKVIDGEAYEIETEGEDPTIAALIRRAPGRVATLALILAAGESTDPVSARVEQRHLHLAYRIARWSIDLLAFKLQDGVVGDVPALADFTRALRRTEKIIEKRAKLPGNRSKLYRSRLEEKNWATAHLDRLWKRLQQNPRFVCSGLYVRFRALPNDSETEEKP